MINKHETWETEIKTEYPFFYPFRTQSQRSVRLKQIERLSYHNYRRFKVVDLIASTKSKTITQTNHLWQKAYFKNGWWCTYTDNQESNHEFKYSSVILTVHGCPGSDLEWRTLEKAYGPNIGRFINFIVPGFDGESEVREDYTGSEVDICKMIINLMNHLKIDKIVFCGHSMGGFIMYKFYLLYPHRINGLIHTAAPIFNWFLGIKTFYGLTFVQSGLAKNPELVNKLDDPEIRNMIVQRIKSLCKGIYFEGKNNLLIQFPNMRDSEICAFVRLCASWNPGKFPAEGKKSSGVLRFLTAGKDDPLVEMDEYADQFYELINRRDQMLDVKLKLSDFDDYPELKNLNLNLSNLQENFVFLFENTGHNVHKKYGRVLGHLIRKYIAILEVIQNKQKQLSMPKL